MMTHLSKQTTQVDENWAFGGEDRKSKVLEFLNDKGNSSGFLPFVEKDGYFYSTCGGGLIGTPHIGSFRFKVAYKPCAEVTILAQQVHDEEAGVWTFRPWNPKKKNVAFGEKTSNTKPTKSWYFHVF